MVGGALEAAKLFETVLLVDPPTTVAPIVSARPFVPSLNIVISFHSAQHSSPHV